MKKLLSFLFCTVTILCMEEVEPEIRVRRNQLPVYRYLEEKASRFDDQSNLLKQPVFSGDLQEITDFLTNNSSYNKRELDLSFSITKALDAKWPRVVECLINNGATIQNSGSNFQKVIDCNDTRLIRLMYKQLKDQSAEWIIENGLTYAITNHKNKAATLLLRHRDDLSGPLQNAAAYKRRTITEYILKRMNRKNKVMNVKEMQDLMRSFPVKKKKNRRIWMLLSKHLTHHLRSEN